MRLVASLALIIGLGTAAAAAPRLLKGPYLQDQAPTSITVMWQADQAMAGTVVVTGPSGDVTVTTPAARIGEAKITGLTPATRYSYRLQVGEKSYAGELSTAPPVGEDVPFSFLVVGDSRSGVETHRRVVERMAQEVPDFILGTGDMVDEGARQDQWQQFFDIEASLLRDNVYFPAVGNHDRQGKGRTADTYKAYFSVPENGSDTERYYAFDYAASRFLVLDSNVHSFGLTDQTAWIERQFISARQNLAIRHIFVVMHHPVFSVSLHGGHTDLREKWTPLFERYGVAAVFSGHDHVYTRAEHDGVRYFVSGGGGAPLYPFRPKSRAPDLAALKKFERAFHFLRVTIAGGRIEITAVRSDGSPIETTTWQDESVPKVPAPAIPAAGARMPTAAPRPIAPIVPPVAMAAPVVAQPGGPSLWFAVLGIGLLLLAAVVVVRTLRKG